MVGDLIGVTVWTDDLERLVEFYRDTLGLALRGSHHGWANFAFGEMRLNLGLHDQVHGPSKDPYRVMLSFCVDNIQSEYGRLSEQGVEFIRVPEKEDWGGMVATFLDPDGNVLQLLEKSDSAHG